jgi:hypothetical protein
MEICVEKLMEAVDTRTADWSEYEDNALPHLVEQARSLVEYYERFVRMGIKRTEEDEELY